MLLPLLATLLSLFLLSQAPPTRAEAQCDLYASPHGRDSASGREGAPLRSAQALATALRPGETGCFESGTYVDRSAEGVRVGTPGITLTAAPGAQAELRGRLWIARGADDVTISDLKLDGRNPAHTPGPVVNAARTRFIGVNVSNGHTVICFILGSFQYGVARETVIERSRIHDCGELPPINHDHGIYVENSRGAVIRDNLIYDNADRGIQLYPQAIATTIVGNVIDGNGEGIIFSSEGRRASSGNLVEGNVISNSRVRWNVESFWAGSVGGENVVQGNCLWGSNRNPYYNQKGGLQPRAQGASGFVARGNLVAKPRFENRRLGDLDQTAASPCRVVARRALSGAVTLHARSMAGAGGGGMLTGYAGGPGRGPVMIERRTAGGAWRRLMQVPLRDNGFFRARAGRGAGDGMLRAVLPGRGISPQARLR